MSPLVEDLPKLSRAGLFNRVSEYISGATQENHNLAEENEVWLLGSVFSTRSAALVCCRMLHTTALIACALGAGRQPNKRFKWRRACTASWSNHGPCYWPTSALSSTVTWGL